MKNHKVKDKVWADTLTKQNITLKNSEEIKFQAVQVINYLEILLNTISSDATTQSELKSLIVKSYSPDDRIRIFYDNKVIVEDDINPQFNLGHTKDVDVDKYLKDFDIYYKKTPDFTVNFQNIKTSNVKKKEFTYVRVTFDSKFDGKFRPSNSKYDIKKREVLLRVEPRDNGKFQLLIVGISFYDPKIPIEATDNDLNVLTADTDYYANFNKRIVPKKEIITPKIRKKLPVLNDSLLMFYNKPDFKIKLFNLNQSFINTTNPVFYLKMKYNFYTLNDIENDSNSEIEPDGELKILMQRNGRKFWNGYIAKAKKIDAGNKVGSNLEKIKKDQLIRKTLNFFKDYNRTYFNNTTKPDFVLKLHDIEKNTIYSDFYLKIIFSDSLNYKYSIEQKIKENIRGEILLFIQYNNNKSWFGFVKSVNCSYADNGDKTIGINKKIPTNSIENNSLLIPDAFKMLTIPLKEKIR